MVVLVTMAVLNVFVPAAMVALIVHWLQSLQ